MREIDGGDRVPASRGRGERGNAVAGATTITKTIRPRTTRRHDGYEGRSSPEVGACSPYSSGMYISTGMVTLVSTL